MDNTVVGNVILDHRGDALKVMRLPQAEVCGNVLRGNARDANLTVIRPADDCR